ncbi:hypothetical protein WMY93_019497 [Mugilogobius chulae]|uniref:Uncharacterized protein n=1 Tax=Mugilogobius chulae TaxID=88201 RepID=A0AAW0NK02_9GOBI
MLGGGRRLRRQNDPFLRVRVYFRAAVEYVLVSVMGKNLDMQPSKPTPHLTLLAQTPATPHLCTTSITTNSSSSSPSHHNRQVSQNYRLFLKTRKYNHPISEQRCGVVLARTIRVETSVVRCLWHPKLNQIMVGTGNGLVKVYYDPVKSYRGAKLCLAKTKRKEKHTEMLAQDYIITPHALPMFREARQRSTKKQLEKDRLDPKKSHKPEPPVSGPGRGAEWQLMEALFLRSS